VRRDKAALSSGCKPHPATAPAGSNRSANTSPLSRGRAHAREAAGNQRPWPADKVERWAIDRLIPYAKNARTHSDAQIAAIAASIKESAPRCGSRQVVMVGSRGRVYPDGPIAVEALRVIGAAMAEAGVVGLGRLNLSRRERMVMVEPRGAGMALFPLRSWVKLSSGSITGRRQKPDGPIDVLVVPAPYMPRQAVHAGEELPGWIADFDLLSATRTTRKSGGGLRCGEPIGCPEPSCC
jgi:hypothetical protein